MSEGNLVLTPYDEEPSMVLCDEYDDGTVWVIDRDYEQSGALPSLYRSRELERASNAEGGPQ